MKQAAFALLLILAFVACDPGRPENTPSLEKQSFRLVRLRITRCTAARPGHSPRCIDEVQRLLEKRASPNARWGQTGDHFPLREAVDTWGLSALRQTEIVRLLLTHGADPNARWCPTSSRETVWMGWPMSAVVPRKVLPLLLTRRFAVSAISSPCCLRRVLFRTRKTSPLRSALDYTNDDVIFELVSREMFPDLDTRDRKALAWLNRHS